MTINAPEHTTSQNPEKAPLNLDRAYRIIWEDIENLRLQGRNGDDISQAITNLQDNAHFLLQSYRDKVELPKRKTSYYRTYMTAELAPALIDVDTKEKFTQEEIDAHIQSVRAVSAGVLADILYSFQPGHGVSFQRSEELVGLINEVTPLALYSRDDTLFLPASYDQDIYQKTDIIGYQFNEDHILTRVQPIQCKTDVRFAHPPDSVPLLHADDFNNRADPAVNVYHDHETSALIIARQMGDLHADDEMYLDSLAEGIWDTLDERLTDDYKRIQQYIATIALRNNSFSQRISLRPTRRT